MEKDSTGYIFQFGENTETSNKTKPRNPILSCIPLLKINSYVFVTILTYIEKGRKNIRKKKSQLLLSFIESHKAISTSTVSSWIIEVSGLAGTDKKYFTVHSTQDQLLKQKY